MRHSHSSRHQFAVSFFTFFEVLGMCELTSAYPTAVRPGDFVCVPVGRSTADTAC